MGTLSMREQLDCLIMNLETNLETMIYYIKDCNRGMERNIETDSIYAYYQGMKNSVEFCAEMIQQTLDAAKKQRARWNNDER